MNEIYFPQKFASYLFNGQIYYSGGYDTQKKIQRDIVKLQAEENDKFKLSLEGQMLDARFEHCMVVRNAHQVYNIGGSVSTTSKSTKRCELFHLKIGESLSLPRMESSRKLFAATLFKQDYIFVFCGKEKEKPLSSVEKLDLEAKEPRWAVVLLKEENWVPRAWISATTLNDEQILIYGHENSSKLNFIFRPNQEQTICFKSDIVTETSGYWCPGFVSQNEEVYVFNYHNPIKLYRYQNQYWEKVTLN